MSPKRLVCVILFAYAGFLLTSCGAGQPFGLAYTPTPTLTLTPTITQTLTITPTFTTTPTSTLTPEPTSTMTATENPDWVVFDHETVKLAYPPEWKVEDRSNDQRCIPGVINCLLRVVASDDPDTRITLILTDFSVFGQSIEVEKMDQSVWDMETFQFADYGLEKDVVLVSKTNIQIDGEAAIRRVFHEPYILEEKVVGTLYVVRMIVVSKSRMYHFYLNTLNSDKFDHYQELMDQISATVTFK